MPEKNKQYNSKYYFSGQDFLCYYWDIIDDDSPFHSHLDYYEFIITVDNVFHHNNGITEIIPPNSILFVRPKDYHALTNLNNNSVKVLYLGIVESAIEDTFNFIGDNNFKNLLLNHSTTPHIQLSNSELEETLKITKPLIQPQFSSFNNSCYYKFTVVKLLEYFYKNFNKVDSSIPNWLHEICVKMHLIENFSQGFSKMLELANCSRGHLCHCMKKYYNTNPTDYINDIRLSYIANQLTVSNQSISQICFDAGFNNVGYMYRLFKEKYDITPSKYKLVNTIKHTVKILDSD